jgi:hypothetical protein
MNVALLVVFGLAFALWLYFAIAKEIVNAEAVREGADRDRWVSALRARQLADEIERGEDRLAEDFDPEVMSYDDGRAWVPSSEDIKRFGLVRVPSSASPQGASGPGGDRPTAGQATPNHDTEAAG